jgi:hypothetical protein
MGLQINGVDVSNVLLNGAQVQELQLNGVTVWVRGILFNFSTDNLGNTGNYPPTPKVEDIFNLNGSLQIGLNSYTWAYATTSGQTLSIRFRAVNPTPSPYINKWNIIDSTGTREVVLSTGVTATSWTTVTCGQDATKAFTIQFTYSSGETVTGSDKIAVDFSNDGGTTYVTAYMYNEEFFF